MDPQSSKRRPHISTYPLNSNLSDSDDTPTPTGTSSPNQLHASTSQNSSRFSATPKPSMIRIFEKHALSPAQVNRGDENSGNLSERESQRTRSPESSEEGEGANRNNSTNPTSSSMTSKFKPVLILQNSGSVARDHLASERTFLAYVRTSLAIASTGVALVQLFSISSSSSSHNSFSAASKRVQVWARPLGVTAVCLGIIVLMIGVTRYFTVQQALTQGKFPVARFLIGGISFVLGVIITIVFGVLVSGGGPR